MKGPKGLALIRHLIEMSQDYVKSYYNLFQEYGEIVSLKLPWRMHIVTSTEIFEKVLSKDFENYNISKLTNDLTPLLGNGLITSNHEQWSSNKRFVWPFFSSQNIGLYEEMIHKQVQNFLNRFPSEKQFNFDISNPIFEMTYQVISNIIFSKNIEADSYSMEKAIAQCVQVIQKKQASLFKIPYWIPTPLNVKFVRSRKLIQNILNQEIESRIKFPEDKPDLLNHFLSSQDEQISNYNNIKNQIITLFITGHETTANTILWAIYLLATNKDIYDKWLTEINQTPGSIPSIKELDNFPYTMAIFKETMRLYPAAPVIPRNAIKPDQFLNTKIESGDEILLSIYNIHRSPKYWQNPNDFIPERFLNNTKIPLYQYLPFGRGKRACLGEKLATIEVLTLLITLGRHFDFLFSGPPVNHISRLTLRQDKPLRLYFKRK